MANFEALFVVINAGFSATVMEAAKEAGANGGTIVHGRGAGSILAQKKYGIAITPEKEIIIILLNKKDVDNVMNALYKVAGTGTPAGGIIFSLPAERVVGLKFDKEKEENEEH